MTQARHAEDYRGARRNIARQNHGLGAWQALGTAWKKANLIAGEARQRKTAQERQRRAELQQKRREREEREDPRRLGPAIAGAARAALAIFRKRQAR